MYNGTVTAAINTGVPAAVVAVSSTGHGGTMAGGVLLGLAAINAALLVRTARLRPRSFRTPTA